jgi:hypothetical protein
MQHLTVNGMRLQARLTMQDSGRRLVREMRSLVAEMEWYSVSIAAKWQHPMQAAFENAAHLQTTRDPGTHAAMMAVFRLVHLYMREDLTKVEAANALFQTHADKLRATDRRLTLAIRAAVRSLGCVRDGAQVPQPRAVDELELSLTTAELAPVVAAPYQATRAGDRTFVARMFATLDERHKKTVTAEEQRRAVAICRRQREDINVHLQRWASTAALLQSRAQRLERLVDATADLINENRANTAHPHRANVIYDKTTKDTQQ